MDCPCQFAYIDRIPTSNSLSDAKWGLRAISGQDS